MSAVPETQHEVVPLDELISRVVRGIERGGRDWTVARRKDSLARMLSSNRNDAQRLQQRLAHLVASWEDDARAAHVEVVITAPTPLDMPANASVDAHEWPRVAECLGDTLAAALPPDEARAQTLAAELRTLRSELQANGATPPLAQRVDAWSTRARRLLAHRHHLFDQMGTLAEELTAGLVELAEDDSWARGQAAAMRQHLREGFSARGVRSVSQLLASTRERQHGLRAERTAAREALKAALKTMLHEVGELGSHTDRFDDQLGRYAEVIQHADSLESLAGAMREMVDESRGVRSLVQRTRARLHEEHERAGAMAARVERLEAELKALSDVVATDPLTGAANRRGLQSAFDVECARAHRGGAPLAIGLIKALIGSPPEPASATTLLIPSPTPGTTPGADSRVCPRRVDTRASATAWSTRHCSRTGSAQFGPKRL